MKNNILVNKKKQEPEINSSKNVTPKLKRLFKYFLISITCLVLISVLVLAFLPRIISTDSFKACIEKYSAHFLRRPIQIKNIQWSWKKGVLIEKLLIKDDPIFSNMPILSIDRIQLILNYERLIHRLLFFDLKLNGLEVRLIREDHGRTNFEYMLMNWKGTEQKKSKAIKKQQRAMAALNMPFDIKGTITLDGFSIIAVDRKTNHSIMIKEGAVRLDIPSLKRKPIMLKIESNAEFDTRPLPPMNLSVMVENMIDGNGRIDLVEAGLKLDGQFLGTHFFIQRKPCNLALTGKLEMDLKPVIDFLKVISGLAVPEITGQIFLKMDSEIPSKSLIKLKTKIRGQEIRLSGGPFKNKQIGPISIKLEHGWMINIEDRSISKMNGEIRVQDQSRIAWNGSVKNINNSNIEAEVSINPIILDLGELSSLINGIIPVNASGKILMSFKGSGAIKKTFNFNSHVFGMNVVVSGIPKVDGEIGVLTFRMSHAGEVNLEKEEIIIRDGEIGIQENSRLSWHGRLKGLDIKNNITDLNFGPVSLNMREIFDLAEKILPTNIARLLTGKKEVLKGNLKIRNLLIKGPIMSGEGQMKLSDFFYTLPYIKLISQDKSIQANESSFHIEHAHVSLASFFPVNFNSSFGLSLSNFNFKGKEAIKIERMVIPSCNVSAKDLSLAPDSTFGIKGVFSIEESGLFDSIQGPFNSYLTRLRHSLKAAGRFNSDSLSDFHLNQLILSAPSFSISGMTHDPIEGDIEAKFGIHATDIRLSSDALIGITGRIDFSEFVRAKGIKIPSHGQISGLNQYSEGACLIDKNSVKIPLTRISFSSPSVRFQASPNYPLMIKTEAGTTIKGLRFKKSDPFRIDVENIQTDLEAGKYLKLRLDSSGQGIGAKGGDLQVKISLGFSNPMSLLPIGLITKPVINGKMLMDCQADRLPAIKDMKKAFKKEWPSLLELLLKTININLRTHVHTDFSPAPNKTENQILIAGKLDAETDIQLEAAKAINASSRFESSGLDMGLGDLLQIRNLQSRLHLQKKYALSFGKDISEKQGTISVPLSTKVIQPKDDEESASLYSKKAVVRRLTDDLIGKINPGLCLDYGNINLGKIPIEISNYQMALRLIRGLPHIDYFQMDIMGGTLIGRLSIGEQRGKFQLKTECSFSGLNPKGIIPGVNQKISDEEAELSGQLYIQIPVSEDIKQVLDELHLKLDLIHIGSRTMERFLYALDPHENNEMVVKQRQLLQLGSPKWVNLRVQGGNLTLSGLVEVKGIDIALPPIERINIVNLPIQRLIRDSIPKLAPGINILSMLSAEQIRFDLKDKIKFISRTEEIRSNIP